LPLPHLHIRIPDGAYALRITLSCDIAAAAGYSVWSYATTNPVGFMGKIMRQLPGFADGFEPLMKEMQKGTTVLRMHIDMFMPVLAAMLKQMPAADPGCARW
jgi:hypothetical protein